MPWNAEPLKLDAERDRLAAEYEDARATADEADNEAVRQRAREAATRAERHAAAVEWLREEFGAGCRVVVGGLTMGEDARVTDEVEAAANAKTDSEAVRGVARNWTVAAGVVEAPFYESDDPPLSERVEAIAELPRHVGKYLHDRVGAAEALDVDLGNG